MVKQRREQEDDSDYTPTNSEVQERPRTSRRAARDQHRLVLDLVATGDMSESEPERAPRVHWRKRLAAAQKVGRIPARKPARKASKRKRGPPQSAAPPVPAQQLQLPPPMEAAMIVQPRVASTQPAAKLRESHHEFLWEYSQHRREVAAAAGSRALAAMRLLSVAPPAQTSPDLHSASSSGAAHEVDAAIAALLDEDSAPAAGPQRPPAASTALSPPRESATAASSQSSGATSSPLAVFSKDLEMKEGAEAYAETESDGDASVTSTIMCESSSGREVLGRSCGSSMWRLPSDAALLTFASCMAA